ncbi:hypothetical protein ACFVXG_34170 [Kitasatospora sp. NPDC058162]|uniref:hypothetical protein n=1 Tax=Kitasatospora sp. NPDC058162 TaxID=3346362 RepID=UPI0036DCA57D
MTSRDGRWLALGLRPGQVVDWRYGAADGAIDRRPAEVRGGGGLCVAEHPFGIGEALTVGDESGAVVRAEPQGVPVGTVSLHAAKGRVRGAAPPRTGADTVEWRVGAAEAAQALFARAEVRDAEGAVAALTNPVLLEPRR